MMKNLFFFTTLFLFSFLVAFSQEYRAIPLIHPAGNLFVSGLNNQGQVCGTVLVDDVNFFNNAVRFEPDGTFSTLALGDLGQSSTASAINDLGHVLGTISRSDFTTAVVIWESDSTYRELEQPD
ncbi:MAG: hypothetical protein OEM26_07520, partial [Saprospiraceae bacterium]|nr:hypothetical protein [Saprospiraceae bacterium]